MTQYSSIRIYAHLTITAGFYDVIGYYGNTPSVINGIYLIDVENGCYPLIKSDNKYYVLDYDDKYENGYIPTDVVDNNLVHPLLDTSIERIIYQNEKEDFNQVDRGYTINQNIDIVNISTQIAAWRRYTMDVYDTYAIRKFDPTIHDDYNLIDDGNLDIILAETNPDDYVFDPTGGNVSNLELFEVDCYKQIDNVKEVTGKHSDIKICIYEKETKTIVASINFSSLKITGTTFKFGLNRKITSPGTYFLYLPSGIITFSDSSSSPMVLIAYTIKKSEDDNDIHAFECQTRGKILSTLDIIFYNVGSYNVSINQTLTINITAPSVPGFTPISIQTSDSSKVYKSDNLTVTIDLGLQIINYSLTSQIYNISIPAGTFELSSSDSNGTINIEFELVPLSTELPVNGNYVVKFTPSHGSKLIKLDLFKVSFCLDNYLDHRSSNVTYSGGSFSIKNLSLQTWSTGFVNLGRTIEYDLGYKMFSYTFRLTNPIDELGNYTITIPADTFALDDGFNSQLICNYDILEFVEEDDQSSNSYLYDMLKIVPKNDYINEMISFKKDNTIFINSTKLSTILFSPVISLVDYKNNDKLTGKIFSFNDNRDSVLEMYCNLKALLESGEWIYDEASYNSLIPGESTSGFVYGLDMYDLRQFYKLYNLSISEQETDGLFFKNKIINELPRSMIFKLDIKLDGNYVGTETNILFLENAVYEKYKENVNWVLEKLIDIYSGEECAHVYVTPNKTNVYDSVVKELVYDPDDDVYKNRYIVELENVTKVRLGNLDGIYNETFKNKQPHGFGLYGLNVFLTGNFYLNNGRSMLDIDNDITMAVGNVNAVKQSLDNLDKQLQQTSELLDLKVSNAEKGVSSTISNFISTNRDAIFKLGLDYSMWSLGSAGISLYNPNVRYKYDEYGNKVVDETTVGDFDEGILIQADKLKINNYYSTTINGIVYYKVLVTSANPKDWIYPDQDNSGLFYPKMRDDTNSSSYRNVPFKYYYIKQELINRAVLCSTLGSADGSILRYVYIMEDDLGNPYCASYGNLGENFTSYAFNSFYSAYTQSSNNNERIDFYTIENNVVTSAQVNDLVWFLPYTIQAALFNNGKIYAKYISTEGLEVEHLIAIPKDLSPWELTGSRNVRKNPDFDISKPITESNYPVICDSIYEFEGNNQYASQPEKTVPFVVISGYTGKITARSADIYGSITVGDRTGTNSKYIVLSDNIDDNAVESGRTPAMYIMSNDNGYPRVIAKFSGDDEGNLLNRYTNLEEDNTSSASSYQISISIQNTYGLGELTTIPNKSESNDVTTLGYPIYSENNSVVYNLICTISHSDKMRNLRFNITPPTKDSTFGLNLDNSGSMTFKSSLANQGKVYGFITYNIDYFIKQGTTMDTNGTKIGSMLMRVFVNDRTSGMSYSNLVPTLLNNIVVNPSESDYIVYYRCWVDMNCYLMYRYLSSDAYRFPLTIDYHLLGINISITPSGLSYFSQYTGNGMSSGYNKDNYFGSYYRMDSNGYPGMITGFRSGGIGMLFDRTNPYYLFPNNFMIPMYIPILYFRGGPYEDTQLLLPSTDPENCYLTVTWKRDTDYDSIYNAYQEYDSDLINFYAMRGNRTYNYNTPTYSDGTPRERSGNTIEINADAVYEFCYYKLDKLLHDNYGIGISTKNVRVNLTRLWGSISGITSYYDNGYHTNQEDTGNHVKVDVITGRTVYISTFLPNFDHLIDDLRFNFLGSIEIYLNPNNSNGQTIDTNYTQELMTYKREKWNEIYTGFYNRYIALTAEQQQLLNLNTMLQSFNTNLLTLNSTSVKETVDSTELNLSNLAPLIESVLSDIENGSGSGDDSGTSVTPPSTSPSSDNTDDLYSVTGNGYHNNTSGAVSADGTSSIPVGKITNIDNSLSGVTPTVWAVYDIEGSNIINKSNVTLDPDNSEYIIKAIVNANSTTSIRKARIFVTFDGGNHYGYVNVYQAAGSGGSTPSGTSDSNVDEYLTTFINGSYEESGLKSDISSITAGSNKYSLLSDAMSILNTYESSIMSDDVYNDSNSIVSLPAGNNDSNDTRNARRGWFMALVLTALFPNRATRTITYPTSDSTFSTKQQDGTATNSILKIAMIQWGIGTWSSDKSTSVSAIESYNISTYEARYKGLLQGCMAFAYLFSNPSFVGTFSSYTSYSYQDTITSDFDSADYDLGQSSKWSYYYAPEGYKFFPYPPANNRYASTGLMGRDQTAFSTGKSWRLSNTSRVQLALSDIATTHDYYITIYNAVTGRSYADNTSTYANKLLTYCQWNGNRTVNLIKNADGFWRSRPAWENEDYTVDGNNTNPKSGTYHLNFGNNSPRLEGQSYSTSYPSGHTGYGWHEALCYMAVSNGLSKANVTNLFKRAYEYSESRVIVGAHWQFCVEMGRIAATCSFATLCGNAKFIELLQLAQA